MSQLHQPEGLEMSVAKIPTSASWMTTLPPPFDQIPPCASVASVELMLSPLNADTQQMFCVETGVP
jgi:hypothetical protein